MLKDNLSNINKYSELDNNIKSGLRYLLDTDFSSLNDGRYEINDDIYINIQSYMTKSSGDYEAHRNYIDIQYIISGEENIGVIGLDLCKSLTEYDSVNDIEFLTGADNFIKLAENEFMILYPTDAHKPCISIDISNPVNVRKAVVKVKI